MRIESAISIHAGIEHEADIVPMGENAIHECPAQLAQLLFTLGVPEKIFAVFADGNIRVHAVAVYADNRLGQERRSQSHAGGNLPANELIKLDLVGSGHNFTIAVIDFKL